ncbi:helix-turn-helix domain-containing protein [Companilactobacillus mindensis]|nr:helix-turn-helix domain-containing protein [Companilactobacillus mindensis]GEO78721.1 transposase [Companilactobacillus mindensis]
MPKYSIETKIHAIKLYTSGMGSTTIAKKLGIHKRSTILRWINLWNTKGLNGLKRSKRLPRYSPSFKMKVIIWLVKNKASYPQTARHFDISNESTVWSWKHQYDVYGADGLADRRKRDTNMTDKKKLTPEQENKELKKRLEYLEAENEYLKKLRAVMHQTKKKPK